MKKRHKYEFDNDNKNAFAVGVILCCVAAIFGLQIRFDMLDSGYGPLFNMIGVFGAILMLGGGLFLLAEYIEYKMYDEEDSSKEEVPLHDAVMSEWDGEIPPIKETDSRGTMEDIDH